MNADFLSLGVFNSRILHISPGKVRLPRSCALVKACFEENLICCVLIGLLANLLARLSGGVL